MDTDGIFNQSIAYTLDGLDKYGYVTRNNLTVREFRDATATNRVYFEDRSYVGAVYDGKRQLIASTLRFNERDIFPVDPVLLDDIADVSAVRCEHSLAVYGGIFFPILGHFYFETISRLWPLLWRLGNPGCGVPIYFHHWPGLDLPQIFANPLYAETLNAIGVSPQDVHIIERPTRFDTLLVPDAASSYHINLDERMQSVFDRITSYVIDRQDRPTSPGADRRIYLSRSGWTENRRIKNEEAIDAELVKRGFEVVHTQIMKPHELFAMLKSTAILVAADGSHAHLAVFCRPGIRVVLLDTRPVPTQFAIAKLRRFQAFHVPLFRTPLYQFEVGITDLEALGRLIDQAL